MNIVELRKKYYKEIDAFDFDILLSFVLKKTREYILTYPEKKLTKKQKEKLESFIKRRKNNEPLAYILGEKEFYSNKFIVNKNVLVPRPETEMMIEKTLHYINQETKKSTIIDIGTGTGCIIISLAKELKKRKNINFYGIDISQKALVVARKNAKLNKVNGRIKFIKSDLLTEIKKIAIENKKSKIIVTANLPYLTSRQIKKSPSIKKEPRLALLAGSDGLKYYRKLFKQLKKMREDKTKINFTIICEIDPSQTTPIRRLAKNTFKTIHKTTIKKDLRGLNRFAVINLN